MCCRRVAPVCVYGMCFHHAFTVCISVMGVLCVRPICDYGMRFHYVFMVRASVMWFRHVCVVCVSVMYV